MQTEQEILALLFARSESAIEALAKQYGRGCMHIACNFLKDRAEAEECVDDAYLAVWNTVPPRRPHPLRTYLYRIVRNLSIGRFHHNTAEKRDSSFDAALDELEECLAAPGGPEEALSVGELSAALNRFLETLPQEQRILFVRRYWYGDSVQELAKTLGLRPNTAAARLSRLREKLRQALEKEGFSV